MRESRTWEVESLSGRMIRTRSDANYSSYILTVPHITGGHGDAMTRAIFQRFFFFRGIEGVSVHSQRNSRTPDGTCQAFWL